MVADHDAVLRDRALGQVGTSWKTRYGALSSVPSRVHVLSPTGRQETVDLDEVARGHVDATAARPLDDAAGAGDTERGRGPEVVVLQGVAGALDDGRQRRDRDCQLA